MTVPQATSFARRHRCLVRVVERDGRRPSIFLDDQTHRINVVIDRGRITKVDGIY
jgi:hypothetical protein